MGLVDVVGIERRILEKQIKEVHRSRHATEYSNLVREVPALMEYAVGRDPFDVFDTAIHAQNSKRNRFTNLYPGVE